MAIVQMEEKGLNAEQAQIEAFLCQHESIGGQIAMGKPTGFMEYERCEAGSIEPKERIKNFNEFHIFLSKENQQKQAARCMDCGVPFCRAGATIAGMTSGCPLHNLVPEWNDLVYTGNWEQAYNRLHKTNNFPEFTSRVCPALCEKACTCGHWGEPVSVRDNEHGVIETAYKNGYAGPKPPKVRTGKKGCSHRFRSFRTCGSRPAEPKGS